MSITKPKATETTGMTPPAQHSFSQRAAAHFKKWWWAYLIAFIAVVLVIILPVVYVGYPNIAQDDVNASTLSITKMVISSPTPTSFTLNQTQVIGSHSSFHPQIYAFEAAVSLLGAAVPFSRVQVPGVQSRDGAEVVVSQTVDLKNASAFGDFAKAVMMDEEVELQIFGRPFLKEGGLPKIRVTYNKTVSMKGLNKLKGFNVTEFRILLQEVNGRNMNGTVLIPNPTVMTIEMGNVTLNLAVSGQHIGHSYLDNLTLKPGNNFIQMTSTVNRAAVLDMVYAQDSIYKDGVVPFQITGNSSMYHGEELPYFTEGLSANNLTVSLNISRAIAEIGL